MVLIVCLGDVDDARTMMLRTVIVVIIVIDDGGGNSNDDDDPKLQSLFNPRPYISSTLV